MNQQDYKPKLIYKSMISNDLREDILNFYLESTNLSSDNGSAYFPKRRVLRDLPVQHILSLKQELEITMGQYYLKFVPNTDYIRIYHSNYGIVKPHQDVPTHPAFTHTCLIYLTDDFYGGVLSVKIPRTDQHIQNYGEPEKKNLTVTMEPRKSYGAIFQKDLIHFNDELLGGDKIILLVDCEIIY
jgi:hypothetical protein